MSTVNKVRSFGPFPSLSGVREAVGQMVVDLRQVLRVAYVQLFVSTIVASFVMLYSTVFVYEQVLDPAVFAFTGDRYGLFDIIPIEFELMLFGAAALVPILNCARVLFLARISGKDPAELVSLRSLFRAEGIELAALVVLVPFLSTQIFEATGLQSVLQTLTESVNGAVDTIENAAVNGSESANENRELFDPDRVQRLAVVLSVLYLYPSIILVYLSHSRLMRLYPFTQFLTIARSWSYILLIASVLPVVAALNQYLAPVIGKLEEPNVDELWYQILDPGFSAVLIVLTTLTFVFVFVRLGTIVVTDTAINALFTSEVDKELQMTLSDFN